MRISIEDVMQEDVDWFEDVFPDGTTVEDLLEIEDENVIVWALGSLDVRFVREMLKQKVNIGIMH